MIVDQLIKFQLNFVYIDNEFLLMYDDKMIIVLF